MRSRNIGIRNNHIGNRDTHPVNLADTDSISKKHPPAHAVDSAFPEQSAKSKRLDIPGSPSSPSRARHSAHCRVCAHDQRQEIEDDFVDWKSTAQIVREYRLANRYSVYRHMRALNLFPKRRRNVRAALERIIEHAGDIEVSASAVVAAVQALAKLNCRGELIEPDEQLELRDPFDRMTRDEYEAYAKDGTVPDWFKDEIAAVGGRVPKGENDA